jgi:hypothetical protein
MWYWLIALIVSVMCQTVTKQPIYRSHHHPDRQDGSPGVHTGLAGLGTVSAGVIKMLNENDVIVGRRAECAVERIFFFPAASAFPNCRSDRDRS